MIRRALCAVTVWAIALFAPPTRGSAQEVDLGGTYQCEGVSVRGNPYRGIVEIVKDDQTYVVRWVSREGPAVGIGILRGDLLAVSYFTGSDVGVVVYRIEPGPRLRGEWSILGADGHLHPETLTKLGLQATAPTETPSGHQPSH